MTETQKKVVYEGYKQTITKLRSDGKTDYEISLQITTPDRAHADILDAAFEDLGSGTDG